jgi:hypothetical protein
VLAFSVIENGRSWLFSTKMWVVWPLRTGQATVAVRWRTGLSGGAPDCPVRCSAEGKDVLQSLPPKAPSCLGAIKGTPRRMEETSKHSLSILRLSHSATAHLIDCVSDLSSVRVVNSLCYVSSSSLGLCACVCCGFVSCVCCSPNLTLCFHCDLYCKGERLQVVEIPRK